MDKHEHRRRRLLELKEWECDGKIARLAERISRSDSYVARMLYVEGKPGKKRIGDDMLDILEAAFKLPRGWFDQPFGTPSSKGGDQISLVAEPVPVRASVLRPLKSGAIAWPFPTVSYQRLLDLKHSLGPKVGNEALRDIDALLDVVVTKWERLGKASALKRS
jgi:hypothetical protein